MSPVKEAAIQLIQALPEDCSSLDILRHLYLHEKLARARSDVVAGRVVSDDEVDERMEQWLEGACT
jgi:hypothetical protein